MCEDFLIRKLDESNAVELHALAKTTPQLNRLYYESSTFILKKITMERKIPFHIGFDTSPEIQELIVACLTPPDYNNVSISEQLMHGLNLGDIGG